MSTPPTLLRSTALLYLYLYLYNSKERNNLILFERNFDMIHCILRAVKNRQTV